MLKPTVGMELQRGGQPETGEIEMVGRANLNDTEGEKPVEESEGTYSIANSPPCPMKKLCQCLPFINGELSALFYSPRARGEGKFFRRSANRSW